MATERDECVVPNAELKNFGIRLQKIRKDRDYTQMDLAAAVGYSSSGAISQIENGLKGMKQEAFLKAAKFLEVDPKFLLGAHGYTSPDEDELLIQFEKLLKTKNKTKKYKEKIKKLLELVKDELENK